MSKITGLEAPNQVPPKVTAMYRAVSTLLREDKDISEMSVSMITGLAGIGKGTAYEYFDSKEEIIVCALLYEIRTVTEQASHQIQTCPDLETQIHRMLLLVEEHSQCVDAIMAFLHLLTDHSKEGNLLRQRIAEQKENGPVDLLVRQIIDSARAKGELREDIPLSYITNALLARMISYLMYQCHHIGNDMPPEEMRRLVTESIMNEFAYDDRSILLDDPGLLAGDPPERIAKKLRVIVADVRYHAEQRTDHVRRVEPSAHADLDDGHVDLPAREMVERHSRRDFEKRRLHAPDRLPVPLDVLDDLPLGDRLPVDTHALAEIFQMGRREQTGPVSGRRQRRGDQMRHGALAVGPGHMHAAEAAVRNARSLFQRDDAVEPRFIGAAADVLKHRQRAIEKIQCLTVVHPISAFGSKDTLFSALQNEKR